MNFEHPDLYLRLPLDFDETEINLSLMKLQAIPEQLKEFKKLEKLNLSYNRLSNPEELLKLLEALPNLKNLNLEGNLFNTFPTIPKSCCLYNLCLSKNHFDKFPEGIRAIQTLELLYIRENRLSNIPHWIGELTELYYLDLSVNCIKQLPNSIKNLKKLVWLNIKNNQLIKVPSLKNLTTLQYLELSNNYLTEFPNSVLSLSKLSMLDLSRNKIDYLPSFGDKLDDLSDLLLTGNPLSKIVLNRLELVNLKRIAISSNQLSNLSILGKCNLQLICYFPLEEQKLKAIVNWPRKYWGVPIKDWKPQWLLEESNTEIRRLLIQHIGYNRILAELSAELLDEWHEYCLLKIPGIDIEDMYLLKMVCPSTDHIHVTRVPPTVTSAEEAITWINHDIHPDSFKEQT